MNGNRELDELLFRATEEDEGEVVFSVSWLIWVDPSPGSSGWNTVYKIDGIYLAHYDSGDLDGPFEELSEAIEGIFWIADGKKNETNIQSSEMSSAEIVRSIEDAFKNHERGRKLEEGTPLTINSEKWVVAADGKLQPAV